MKLTTFGTAGDMHFLWGPQRFSFGRGSLKKANQPRRAYPWRHGEYRRRRIRYTIKAGEFDGMNMGRAISERWQQGFASINLWMLFYMFSWDCNQLLLFDGGCVNASSFQVVGRVEDLDKHEVPESFKRCTLQWEECWSICLLDTVYGSILKINLGQVHWCWCVMVRITFLDVWTRLRCPDKSLRFQQQASPPDQKCHSSL